MAWTREQYIGTLWALTILTGFLVCTRVYVRATTIYRPWRELILIFAWLAFLTETIANTLSWYHIDMDTMLGKPGHAEPTDYIIMFSYKMNFITIFCLTNGLNACKAVLLLTCFDLCHYSVFPKLWWSIMVTFVILFIMEFGVGLLYIFLQCYPAPLANYWSATEVCDNRNFTLTLWTTNAGTDLIITVIPLILVAQLESLGRLKKIGVFAMFGVGFLNVAAVLMYFTTWLITSKLPKSAASHWLSTYEGGGLTHFMTALVLPTAIIVVCVPQLRVFGRWKFGRKVAVSVYRTFGGTYAEHDTDTLTHTDSAKIEDVKKAEHDEENRWSDQKLAPETTVVPADLHRVQSGTSGEGSSSDAHSK